MVFSLPIVTSSHPTCHSRRTICAAPTLAVEWPHVKGRSINMRLQIAIVFATVISSSTSLQVAPARADSWRLPVPKFYFSQGGGIGVRIVPRGVASQLDYFTDLSEGRPDPGLPENSITTAPQAEIYRDTGYGSYRLESSFQLLNLVSPVSALLSDDGRYLVTFDNWHSVGRGDHVVVVYETDGTIVRSMRLSDLLTEQDISGLSNTVSSTHWSGEHYIDSGDLVLRIATCALGEPECSNRYADLRISLATGLPHTEKKDLLPHWEPQVKLELEDSPAPQEGRPLSTRCQTGWSDESFHRALRVPLDDLLLEDPPRLPTFTEIALKAKIHGKLRFELLVSSQGRVVCVRNLKSLPMGLTESATETILAWQLGGGKPTTPLRSAGMTLSYDLVLVPP